MAVVISGVNNNDKITATDGSLDLLSVANFSSEVTVPSFKVGSNIQLGNAGVATATTFVGNLTGNVNATSNLLDGEESTALGWDTAPNFIRVISSIGAPLHMASTKVCSGFSPDFSAMLSSAVSNAFIAPCFLPV